MTTIATVIDQMLAHGMPQLPAGHPVMDGKIHRFGPKKKAWYSLREIDLKSGAKIVGGSFGIWQGDNNNAVKVAIDWKEVSPEERAQAEAKQREHEAVEREKKIRMAEFAANRARMQWDDAVKVEVRSPYLDRKKVTPEKVRSTEQGVLLVPMYKYSVDERPRMVGLQKIAPDGSKLFNKGMEKQGAACLLGDIGPGTTKLVIVEGYATGRSIRMATENHLPVMVAFDAGNLVHVARTVRAAFPDIQIIFAADDDWMLEQRLEKMLLEDYKVGGPFHINGEQQDLIAQDGTPVQLTATWRNDANGVDLIDVDLRAGRQIRSIKLENAGMSRAIAAAKEVGLSSVTRPFFAARGELKLSDFNDLHVEQSLDAVTAQILVASSADPEFPAVAPPDGNVVSLDDARNKKNPPPDKNGTDQGSDTGPGPAVESGQGGGKKKKKVERPQSFWDSVDHLLEHFVLLYGTNTAWDSVNRLQIKITDLRYAYGSDAVKFWLGNGDRRMINSDRLVFDPTEKSDPATTVNMFRGFAVKPKKGDCDKILDLLSHLCDGNPELTDWIIKWIAYPLQHPGAKMETSIIMHGDEGSGKNLFWEKVVRRMYGEYGGVIGNAQIEAQFNEWASQKLFFVADEVVTRNELKQLKGKLKNMISGEEIRVNPKNLPERSEANHLNFVFLSNELKPLELDKTDRRYLVVWTPAKRELAYYKEVADQIYDGGMEAFYYHLLCEVDCGDFNQHTKPIDTKAKAKLISLGLSGPERFYREWSAGGLPLPFICCSAMQLYAAFQRWSHLNGERFPPTQTEFGGKVERMAAGEVVRKIIKYDAGGLVKQRTVYLVGKKPEDKQLSDWVEGASALFEADLKKYRHVYDQSEQT